MMATLGAHAVYEELLDLLERFQNPENMGRLSNHHVYSRHQTQE
jgi:hypothetical protein